MSGFDRCWLTCVFLLSVGYIPSWAAKLQNSYDICKFFEPRRANLRHEAVFESFNDSNIHEIKWHLFGYRLAAHGQVHKAKNGCQCPST